jgi:hypothetical protein
LKAFVLQNIGDQALRVGYLHHQNAIAVVESLDAAIENQQGFRPCWTYRSSVGAQQVGAPDTLAVCKVIEKLLRRLGLRVYVSAMLPHDA